MTAPALERTQQHTETWDTVMGLALLWLMPVIGFVLVVLGLT